MILAPHTSFFLLKQMTIPGIIEEKNRWAKRTKEAISMEVDWGYECEAN